jgi:xanthine dehydrogenase large subunit
MIDDPNIYPLPLAGQPTSAAHKPSPHESAHLHALGEATYVDDLPELHGTLHGALGLSTHAHAEIESIDLKAVRSMRGVVDVLLSTDIPGSNECGPIVHDDPILADKIVQYVGQPIFMVVAHDREVARRAAKLANIRYKPLSPALTIFGAHQRESYVVPPVVLQRGHVTEKINAAQYRLKGNFSVGGQEQFYLEGQIAYAVPKEDACIHLYCSTQHPTEMQHVVAHALNLNAHQVVVEMRRMGGGFGGKESQSALFAALASVAAQRLNRPVKLRPDRDDDMMITGKRHCFEYTYEVGFNDQGCIEGVKVEMLARAGFSADLSGPVITRAVCHFDNAYYLSDVDIRAYACRTHTQSNTAFRGFGGPQGAIAIEYIIDDIARTLKLDPLQVRKHNFYGVDDRNLTPYGQTVTDNIMMPLVLELEQSSDYNQRRRAIDTFNQNSPILKKGLALTPVKFGISFNVPHLNQAGALVHIYVDGSILVNHGGTEMGQGLNTKVAQVVAHVLGVDLKTVKSTAADTSKVPNTSATAASTGTDLNGKAAEHAALQIRQRLTHFLTTKHGGSPTDFVFSNNQVFFKGDAKLAFVELCRQAYEARIQLWSDGFYCTPNIHWDRNAVRGSPFYYFAYGAAVSEVLIDTLTGEYKLLQADLLHDAGRSLNPAIDMGQIEGGFIQGVGWLTSEELNWNQNGKLTTHAPSTYKIPSVHDCPAHFLTALYRNENKEDTILRSKAVGEPPLLLSFSVFFAIRDAVASTGHSGSRPMLNAPATPESILNAIESVQDSLKSTA